MKFVEYRAVYTDLDSLLDTRFATLSLLFPNTAKQVYEDGSYLTRKHNVFCSNGEIVNLNLIEPFYRKRKAKLLSMSMPTNLIFLIRNSIEEFTSSIDALNPSNNYKVFINIFPYELSIEDKVILESKFNAILSDLANIELIYKNPSEVDIHFLKKHNIIDIFLYDGLRWLNMNVTRNNMIKEFNINNMRFFTCLKDGSISKDNKIINATTQDENVKKIEEEISNIIPTVILDLCIFSYVKKIEKEDK